MAFQFPPSPAVDQTFTPVAGVTYRWSGTAWHLIAGPGAFLTAADADTRYVNVDEAQNTTNRIINGKMAIDQRNAGAIVPVNAGTSGAFCPDRWFGTVVGAGAFTLQRLADTGKPGEFLLVLTVSTPDAVLDAGDLYTITHRVEGQHLADLNWGGAIAAPITLAFDVISTVAGTFAVSIRNAAGDRSYVKTFTVTNNVRTTIVMTIPGDTTGTWDKTNGNGMSIGFSAGMGSTRVAPAADSWQAGSFLSVAGCTNLMATISQQLLIGNVRLYKGSVDFGPDRRLYAEELALCQRYYEKSFDLAVVPASGVGAGGVVQFLQGSGASATQYVPSVFFAVRKRGTPTIVVYNSHAAGNQIRVALKSTDYTGTATNGVAGEASFTLSGTTPAGSAAGDLCTFHWTASAEL